MNSREIDHTSPNPSEGAVSHDALSGLSMEELFARHERINAEINRRYQAIVTPASELLEQQGEALGIAFVAGTHEYPAVDRFLAFIGVTGATMVNCCLDRALSFQPRIDQKVQIASMRVDLFWGKDPKSIGGIALSLDNLPQYHGVETHDKGRSIQAGVVYSGLDDEGAGEILYSNSWMEVALKRPPSPWEDQAIALQTRVNHMTDVDKVELMGELVGLFQEVYQEDSN